MLWLLANWRIAATLGAVIASFSGGWYVEAQIAKGHLARELEAQKQELVKKCEDAQAITKGANDGLQKANDAIAAKLATLKRLQPSRCIAPSSKTDMAGLRGEHAGQNGNVAGTSDAFRDYGATCEEIRQSYLICVKFVDDERH